MNVSLHQVSIVVVTYNRSTYLARLLDSISQMSIGPTSVIVVDNASQDDTYNVVTSARTKAFPQGVLHYERLGTNTGGAGGFSRGMELALEGNADWIWVMDDDVEVLPDSIVKLGSWMPRFKCIQGRRIDADGTPYFWQNRMINRLGIPWPGTKEPFSEKSFSSTNVGCFEGMLVHRDIVEQIGLPDPRFFITWDDTIYGWLASRYTDVVYINEFLLRRARPLKSSELGSHQVTAANDLFRFHIMRNRAYVARYFQLHGAYNKGLFAFGTLITFGKEFYRAVVVEGSIRGLRPLLRGLIEGRRIHRDKTWAPMPGLQKHPVS